MTEWLEVLLALLLLGVGLKTLCERRAELPTLRGMADELDDGEPGWSFYGWPAVLIGCAEIALGLWWRAQTLGP